MSKIDDATMADVAVADLEVTERVARVQWISCDLVVTQTRSRKTGEAVTRVTAASCSYFPSGFAFAVGGEVGARIYESDSALAGAMLIYEAGLRDGAKKCEPLRAGAPDTPQPREPSCHPRFLAGLHAGCGGVVLCRTNDHGDKFYRCEKCGENWTVDGPDGW